VSPSRSRAFAPMKWISAGQVVRTRINDPWKKVSGGHFVRGLGGEPGRT